MHNQMQIGIYYHCQFTEDITTDIISNATLKDDTLNDNDIITDILMNTTDILMN